MTRRSGSEQGAALLAVLLLVAITGAIAVAAMEALSLSRAAAANAAALDQGRAHADGVEQLAILAIDDLIAGNPERTTLDGGWNGAVRTIALPGGVRSGSAAIRSSTMRMASCSTPAANARPWSSAAALAAAARDSLSPSIAAAAIAPVTATSSSTASRAAPFSLSAARLIARSRPGRAGAARLGPRCR